jgi:hypothetical protein
MNALVQQIAKRVSVDYCQLSIVSNQDGCLTNSVVRGLLLAEHGIEVVSGSNFALRLHYELHYKSGVDGRYIYVTQSPEAVLPDMKQEAHNCSFDISDLFPLFSDKALLRHQPIDVLQVAFDRFGNRPVRGNMNCRREIEAIVRELEQQRAVSVTRFTERFSLLKLDWSDMLSTIDAVSDIFIDAVKAGLEREFDSNFASVNDRFQQWIDDNYFLQQNSSHIMRSPCVNKVLPHIANRHQNGDKVALLVVDGLAYWQYAILREALKKAGITTADDVTLSWLPSITSLSRQALFRGDMPKPDYKQNPTEERKLWYNYWQTQGVNTWEIQYLYDNDEFAIIEGVTRLAIVTVEMDDKMHAAYDYRDLLTLTENWAPRFTQKIATLKSMGFTIYLTTDHGSKLARGWRALTPVEKVFLYKDGSRGKRHLIYNSLIEMNNFYRSAEDEVALLKHDNWLCVRGDECFARSATSAITHGGSSLSEVVIPFIRI